MIYHHIEPDSHAGAWLGAMFSYRRGLIREMLACLGSPSPIEDELPDKSFFGRVVECAVGLTLIADPGDLRLLGCLPPGHARRVLTLAGFMAPATVPEAALDQWRSNARNLWMSVGRRTLPTSSKPEESSRARAPTRAGRVRPCLP